MPGGNPIPFRSLVRRPDLARTIARFGMEGAKPFYTGDLGRLIVEAVRAQGGAMTEQDLAGYHVKERAPLVRTFGSRTIATMPAPSAGGLMLLEAATMYGVDDKSALHAMGFGSSAYLHTLAEVMRGAIADRVRVVGDPDLEPGVDAAVTAALEPSQLAARRARIALDKTHAGPEFKTREEGTSHLVVADAEGNVVSLTTTINTPFGARVVPRGTGILLDDELLDFTHPGEQKEYGVTGPGPNRPRANARPVSSMTPTIVLENGEPVLALGGSGGRRIATEVTQAALARLVFGLDPSTCVSAPRIFTNGKEIFVEPDVVEDVRAGLRARGETVTAEPPYAPAVQMVAWDRSGGATRIQAASDPRKAGFAAAQ
jgi:gamma-glutamyltranspeptidase/glutathione hydrolase